MSSFTSMIEIPIPPSTLPLFHDAMCTAINIAISEAGTSVIQGISHEYDYRSALSKVVITGNIDGFKSKIDTLFGTQNLKPSDYITTSSWSYTADQGLVSLRMGGNRFPPPFMTTGKIVSHVIRRQCYLFAKGFKYIALREEGVKVAPVKGFLKLGFHNSLVYLFYKVLNSTSRVFGVLGQPYLLMLLFSEVAKTVDEAFEAVRNFYRIEYEEGRIELNEEIFRYLVPYGAFGLVLEAPDLVYHSFTLMLVKKHLEGGLDVTKLPTVSIYVFPGGKRDESKDMLLYFNYTKDYLQGVYRTINSTYEVGEASRMIEHINRALQYLGDIVRQAQEQKRKEFTAIEAVIPHIRALLNNLLAGSPVTMELFKAVRLLKELENIDVRFKRLAYELLEAVKP